MSKKKGLTWDNADVKFSNNKHKKKKRIIRVETGYIDERHSKVYYYDEDGNEMPSSYEIIEKALAEEKKKNNIIVRAFNWFLNIFN